MNPYVVSRTVEVSTSGRRTVHTTTEAPTMIEALTMYQVVRMQDAGIESTVAQVVRFALDERTAQAAREEWGGGGEVIEPDEVLIVGRVGGVLAVGVRGECRR